MKSLSFFAVTLLTAVNAATVTFKVIAPTANNQVEVNINGVLTTLTASDPDVPYYTGSADLPDGQKYMYVVDGVAESFDRTLETGSSTRNEFYSRPVTYATNIPQLPSILTEGAWNRGSTSDPIWDGNYIPSIFVTAPPNEMENLIENVPKTTYKAKITYIGPDDVTTFEDCTLGLHRPGRKNNDAKQSWVWALPEGKFMANRNWFKIRHQEEDPTQLREKLWADISRSMGTYVGESNLVRFFVNKEGMGTFNMLDDVIKYSYINAMFYGGNTPSQFGGLYDGGSGADFNPETRYDNFSPNDESPLKQDAIGPFAVAMASVDFENDDEVKAISEYFDYDQFLRFMVLEFLTGHWDGYWMEQTNDGAYIEVSESQRKLYYLAQDFDATFGVNLAYGRDFVNVPYSDYSTLFPKGYLINKFLENPGAKATFEQYLKTTSQQIFNSDMLEPYITARHEFIKPDLDWDRSIKQRSPGNIFGWTADQTTENLYGPVVASGKKSGGAEWGLLEWIEAKQSAVFEDLNISEASADSAGKQVTSPNATSPKKDLNAASVGSNSGKNDATEKSTDLNQAAASKEELVNSAASLSRLPNASSAMVVAVAVAALL